jgi:hypothetical protein
LINLSSSYHKKKVKETFSNAEIREVSLIIPVDENATNGEAYRDEELTVDVFRTCSAELCLRGWTCICAGAEHLQHTGDAPLCSHLETKGHWIRQGWEEVKGGQMGERVGGWEGSSLALFLRPKFQFPPLQTLMSAWSMGG